MTTNITNLTLHCRHVASQGSSEGLKIKPMHLVTVWQKDNFTVTVIKINKFALQPSLHIATITSNFFFMYHVHIIGLRSL